jgi:hypothetical protein
VSILNHHQNLRVEENPLLEMPHLEAASILLVGPTLKKFNDQGTPRHAFYCIDMLSVILFIF